MAPQPRDLLVIGTTTPKIKPGGIPSFIHEAKALPRYRNAIFLEWGDREDDRQLSLGRFSRGLLMRTFVSQLRLLSVARRFSEIEVHSVRTGLSALIFHRRKCIFFYHGPGFQEAAVEGAGPMRRLWLYLIESLLLNNLKGYLTASEAFKLRLRENHAVPLSLVEVIRPQIALDRAAYATTIRQKIEQTSQTGIVNCIICRRLVQRVGILEFLTEFARSRDLAHVRVSIVGHGPLEAEIRQASAMDHRVTFLGELSENERDREYSRALFNLVPTQHLEGLGMVLYEGVKYGTIPLTTNVGGMPELIEELQAGVYFSTMNSLVQSIGRGTAEDELARQEVLVEMATNPVSAEE